MNRKKRIDVSIVIPMLNEEESISLLLQEIEAVVSKTRGTTFEIIVVDDGSTDLSACRVKEFSKTIPEIRLVKLKRRFGQTAAMAAGIDNSTGRIVVTLDADGQNDPGDIPLILSKMSEGFDCVSGRRAKRRDKFLTRRLPSLIANILIRKVTTLDINDFGCTLKGYNGELIRSIPIYGDMHRLLPYYVWLAGGKVVEIDVNHRPRKFGESKYGIARTFRVINDLLVAKVQGNFFARPMHLFGTVGFVLLLLATASIGAAAYFKIMGESDLVQSPLLLIAGILLLTGFQVMFTGLLAEIILRRINFASREQRYVVSDN
jgi:glycosyltransferase involved in cell wall biosynthesis